LRVVTESVHAVTYFASACRHALRDAGLQGFWSGYFAARAAPLGAVGPGVVTATFFNFHPAMVGRAVPGCWDVVAPSELTIVRASAASEALGALCAPSSLATLRAVLPLLRAVTAQCDGAGRALAGANRRLWPGLDAPLRRLGLSEVPLEVAEVWQACTTLREHRGDGHVAALTSVGLTSLGAHLLASGALGVPAAVLRDNRGWSEDEWNQGIEQLSARGWLGADGTATAAGHEVHRTVEALTDELAETPYSVLSDGEVHDLYGALAECARQIHDAGVFPFPNPMGLPPL
jgi:hypothetical protein